MKKKHQQQVELHKNEGDSKSLSITILAIIIFLLSTGISYFLKDIFSREIIAKIFIGGTVTSILLLFVANVTRKSYHNQADNYLEYKSKIKNKF
jgi:hypothetical protein